MDVRVVVGGNVRRLRKAAGMSQETLANAADIGQQHVSDIERGKLNISIETLHRVATALEVKMVVLVEGL